MQFKEKLLNKTWENSKKPNYGPKFDHFDSNLDLPIFFFHGFYIY